MKPLLLGLDLGSVNVRAVLVDQAMPGPFPGARPAEVRWSARRPVRGRPAFALDEILAELDQSLEVRVQLTGAGGRAAADPPAHGARLFGPGMSAGTIPYRNEIVAVAEAAAHLCPGTRSIIEIGGHASRFVLLSASGSIEDFALNEQCAAGTGAFIEQQAARLHLRAEELSTMAVTAPRGAAVAGRCSVFAKSDMIHLQQKGVPVEEIAFGLCRAVARNFVATLLRGRRAPLPAVLLGGASANRGLRRAFAEVLGSESEPRVPPLAPFFPAIGAALLSDPGQTSVTVADLRLRLATGPSAAVETPSLSRLWAGLPEDRTEPVFASLQEETKVEAYLGVDVGSVSTNFCVMDRTGRVRDGIYLPTRGRPLEVVREGLGILRQRVGSSLQVLGLGATGSGRHLAAALLGADVVHNEISCQLWSALHYLPETDTIIEIGGQDSKFIRAEGGRIRDFAMNKICAAGTGSFLEEEAARLGVSVEREFADLALRALRPAGLGCRCTVFMDSEVVKAQAKETEIADICAGLAYSIARNYLERVVEGRGIGEHVVMQGGVASNRAVAAAFSELLGKTVLVHPHNRISGAIGAALAAREWHREKGAGSCPSVFRGLEAFEQPTSVNIFECGRCENRCQVSRVSVDGTRAHFGDACERFSARDKGTGGEGGLPHLQAERDTVLRGFLRPRKGSLATLGLPWASFLHEQLPFWATFLHELGFGVRVSSPSSTETLEVGSAHLPAETCLPVKLAFGHVQELVASGVDAVFVPSLVRCTDWQGDSAVSCPYVQSVPFMLAAGVRGDILSPEVSLDGPPAQLARQLRGVLARFGVAATEIRAALRVAAAAQRGFGARLRSRGAQVLAADHRVKVALLGRPYNLCDSFLNLNLASHLRRLGALAVPLDFLPVDAVSPEQWDHLPWRYSRDVLRALMWVLEQPGLHPIVVSSYGCGPDAFVGKHLDRVLRDVPHLALEFDEHRAEAGLITRLEAFLDKIAQPAASRRWAARPLSRAGRNDRRRYRGRRIFVPFFADHAHAVVGAFRAEGMDARLLPVPDRSTVLRAERCTSGRECHAYALLAADLDALSERHQSGDVYCIPGATIPCLIQQYGDAMQFLLEERGVGDLELLCPDMEGYKDLLGYRGVLRLYQGLLGVDLLLRAACSLRPYEVEPGATDRAHAANLHDVERGLAERSLEEALKRCSGRLAHLRTACGSPRPLVGIAGDIYTRVNPVANQRLFWRLEELGCEVWPSPFLVDIAEYGLLANLRRNLERREARLAFRNGLVLLWQMVAAWQVRRRIQGHRFTMEEPDLDRCLELAGPYIGRANMDLLQWNVAKIVDFATRGADGVVNAVAQNCMVGTISGAVARRIRDDHGGLPLVTLVFGGAESASLHTSLEAFVHQVRRRAAGPARPARNPGPGRHPGSRAT
jgi:predicted CoA-substrate-specific enzyme activase